MRILAMILAGGSSPALSILTAERAEPSIPFGGKYRIIDFSLSNLINSDIFNVAVLTQYKPRSLNDHIGNGKPWDLDRAVGGVRLLQPYVSGEGEAGAWQRGTADAVRFNLDYIAEQRVDTVLILAGDHIYKMDYRPMLRFHEESNADCTIGVRSVSPYEAHRFGMVGADSSGRVTRFEEKPRRTLSRMASMGIYVFKGSALVDWLTGPGAGDVDFGRHVVPGMLKAGQAMYAHGFDGYWMDAGTVQAYWEANMALLAETPALDLYDPDWVIHTRSEQLAPAFTGAAARVEGSLLCDGCQVFGGVTRSIIGPGAVVEEGAEVSDSIIMNGTVISAGARVERSIIDKRAQVGEGSIVGWGNDPTPNRVMPNQLNTGLTLIGKRAQVPAGLKIGRNVVIRPRVVVSADGGEVASGETL
ncbi:MAG TPA: sugar phosphate nucleotidyltransferase [Anaerolineae bacterium]|nr:sugar phosphate nucleotidyltransferase [Anaerolineae bacterium]HNU04279.1 sugar phosphate nucleotidyltransferase [Anaerolineae bacterium]